MSPNPQPKREKQMEGKIRERERRAFTARMIDGLRQHGNYNLAAGASMNQVFVAVVSEAGYTVDSDGTTYRPPPPSNPSNEHERNSNPNPQPAGTIMGDNAAASTSGNKSRKEREKQMEHMFRERDRRAFTTRIIDGLRQHGNYNLPTVHTGEQGNEFLGTPYVLVYVMLSSGIINNSCQLVDLDGVKQELQLLKSLNIDGVVVNCWWGIVERWKNQKYEWSGYRELFNIIRNMELKLQVVMAFNAYAGNDFNVDIPLSEWVLKIGKDNPEIFFTDRVGRWNTECLSWGIDTERILEHRTGQEVYYEFMRSFRAEFNDLFTAGLISEVPFFF
nr:beta-amylase 8 [Ipomoea batatas]